MAPIVNAYLGTWSNYRPGKGKFEIGNINPRLINMLSYAFFGIQDDGKICMLDSSYDSVNIPRAIGLKRANSNLKVLAVVGGWTEGSVKYSAMAADANRRSRFVRSSSQFLRQHGFDGLDLDWEYPAQRGGSTSDRANFVTLLRELYEELHSHGLMLGIAVGAGQHSASISYDIPRISRYVDIINIMTYDFSTHYDGSLGHNAPLYGNGGNNVQAAVDYWLKQGAPASKILLGLGFYGHSFATRNGNEVGNACSGAGPAGTYTREAGTLSYYEIKDMSHLHHVWDSTACVPYAYGGGQWISYDNERSIREKIRFAKSRGLRGVMIWSLDFDAFNGAEWPLLKVAHQEYLA